MSADNNSLPHGDCAWLKEAMDDLSAFSRDVDARHNAGRQVSPKSAFPSAQETNAQVAVIKASEQGRMQHGAVTPPMVMASEESLAEPFIRRVPDTDFRDFAKKGYSRTIASPAIYFSPELPTNTPVSLMRYVDTFKLQHLEPNGEIRSNDRSGGDDYFVSGRLLNGLSNKTASEQVQHIAGLTHMYMGHVDADYASLSGWIIGGKAIAAIKTFKKAPVIANLSTLSK